MSAAPADAAPTGPARPFSLLRYFSGASVVVVVLLALAAVVAGRLIIDHALLEMERDESDSLVEDLLMFSAAQGYGPGAFRLGPPPETVVAELRRELVNFNTVEFTLLDREGTVLWGVTPGVAPGATPGGPPPRLWPEGLAGAAAGNVTLRWEDGRPTLLRGGARDGVEAYVPIRGPAGDVVAVARMRRDFSPVLVEARRGLLRLAGVAVVFGVVAFASLWLLVRRADRTLVRQHAALAAAEDELRRRNEKLVELDRRKDEFYTICSHDLRSPLLSMHAGCRVLLERSPGLSELELTVLRENLRGAEGALRLVDDLLDLARIEAGRHRLNVEPVPLARLLAETVAGHRLIAETRGVHLSVAEPVGDLVVEADRFKLRRILDNLVGNAIRHAPGAAVTLRVDGREDEVGIAVEDGGPGIPPELLPTLFERFTRGEDGAARHEGAGLGLSIARDFAVMHGGRIEVVSRPGAGAVFTVVLPRRRACGRS